MAICFLFQAEDGIRDRDVTGVQTCALPIYLYCNCYIENSGPVYVLKKNGNDFNLDTTSLSDLNVGYINDIFSF